MTPTYWTRARRALSKADPVLASIIREHPRVSLRRRGEPFYTLARSIVGQQISVRAAQSVWDRLVIVAPAMQPQELVSLGTERLRACGLSGRKVEYIHDLSARFVDGTLHPAQWEAMDDEAVIAELVKVRGIGRWTAEMFLIFNLLRPDVLPLDDIGLQRAVQLHYFRGRAVTPARMRKLAKVWQPWRSVATWYLWRSLDPVPVEY